MKKRNNVNNKIFYILILAVAILLVWVVYNLYQSVYFGTNYDKALNSETPGDICATPPGYTNEQWREHMGHHPDRYKECLK
ncbi:hypothetical protein A3K63_01535 [Candidatus Micrarchaeota archaeon RBG_16_49_10]|nr:MAG: hypothetical protein A3K63_01535 [Candidatus Micrarchaeota archaeon RBG_16_49_10]